MHSPIIYLIKKSKDTNYNGLLPEDKEPEDELLLHLIYESDWLEPNTLSNQSWHRNDWLNSYKDIFDESPYYEYINKENHSELMITRDNIKQWCKRVIELHQLYAEALQKRLDKDEFFMFNPFDENDDPYILKREYDSLVGQEYGGVRFVVYEEYEKCSGSNELELYDVFSMKQLIEHVKDDIVMYEKDAVTFEICHNISGDYHF